METEITNIKDLPLLDRPRERLARDGAAAMSNAELLAILLGSGNKTMPLMRICSNLVCAMNNNVADLGRMSIEQLSGIKGIGATKAITLIAALELGKRSVNTAVPLVLKDDREVEKFIRPYFTDERFAQYHLILMNHRDELLATSELTAGENKLPQLKSIIKLCLEAGAAGMMICRNEVRLAEKHLNQEKAFIIQLDAAASMLKIKMRGLLVVE